jgi:hypothetical protein
MLADPISALVRDLARVSGAVGRAVTHCSKMEIWRSGEVR